MSERFRHGYLSVSAYGPAGADPVVILHGWGSSAAIMEPVARALSDAWRVYNVDLPGHGAAPEPDEPMDLADHAATVATLIREVAPAGAAILGHSNGGRIALYLASDESTRAVASRLVLVSPSGIRRRRTAVYWLRRVTAATLKAPFRILPRVVRDFGLDWLRHSLVWRLLGSSDYRNLEGVMRETFVRLVNAYLEDRLDRIECPVLIFRGDRDDAVTADQMERLVRGLPDAGLVPLVDAGHYGFLEQPDVFLAGTRHFLREAR
jgi:pimeloyl-ACP methyl ester carboxylesterase